MNPDGVNDQPNSQLWPVPLGDYQYVSLIMCNSSEQGEDGVGTGENNFIFNAGEMGADHEVSICDPYTGYSETPINISEGGSITITLNYDLNRLIDTLKYDEGYENDGTIGAIGNNCYKTDEGVNGAQYCPKTGQEAFQPVIE